MPPRIDLNTLPSLDQIKAGPVTGLKKFELLSLAQFLNLELPANTKVNELKKRVSGALGSQEFVNDTRFHKFTVHRSGTTGGAAIKNSADKDKQDVNAAKKPDIALSGAHGKLLHQNAKTDPAPQFKPLNVSKSAANPKDKERAETGDSDSSLSNPPSSDEREDKPNKPSSKIVVDLPPSHTLRTTIPLFKAEDGRITTSLKKLVPAALTQLSPAKGDRYSKISLITDAGSGSISLGEAHLFMSGDFPEFLNMSQADTCELERLADRLVCYFLWRPGKPPSVDLGSSSKIKPLDLARARKKTPAAKKKRFIPAENSDEEGGNWPENETDRSFMKFLNSLVGGRPDGYPDTLVTIGGQLERWTDRNRAFQYCEDNCKTGRHGKPYRVPTEYKEHENKEYREYANRPFTKKCITAALGISNGTSTSDKKLFTSPDIAYDPLAERWVKGDSELSAKDKARFDKMKRSEFQAHLDEAKADKVAADKAARRLKEKTEKMEKRADKRRHESDDSVIDSEEERRLERRLKKIQRRKAEETGGNEGSSSRNKGKGRAAPTSNNLDSD
ncbi:hypothetical protein B0H12DRAFT_1238714 [Mycena haematopus]|nr:hypothetical protein B0H12DRAFT_1242604 [Mycena haematopus]KAJ7235615.1 hypothetical protein B0H12DRAFT_1238714 [Mycena haematopus]